MRQLLVLILFFLKNLEIVCRERKIGFLLAKKTSRVTLLRVLLRNSKAYCEEEPNKALN